MLQIVGFPGQKTVRVALVHVSRRETYSTLLTKVFTLAQTRARLQLISIKVIRSSPIAEDSSSIVIGISHRMKHGLVVSQHAIFRGEYS